MDRMKFYIYSSNIAIILFSLIFILMGFHKANYILMGLGILLTVYGIFRFFTMLKAIHQQNDTNEERKS